MTISIRELHAATGRVLRQVARRGRVIVTDRRRRIAVIEPYVEAQSATPLPKSHRAWLLKQPKRTTSCTNLISQERDER